MKNKVVIILSICVVVIAIAIFAIDSKKSKDYTGDEVSYISEAVEPTQTTEESAVIVNPFETSTPSAETETPTKEIEEPINYGVVDNGYDYIDIEIVTDGQKEYIRNGSIIYDDFDIDDDGIISIYNNGSLTRMYYPQVEVEVSYVDNSDYPMLCRFYVEADYISVSKIFNDLFTEYDLCEINSVDGDVYNITCDKFFSFSVNIKTLEVTKL